MKLRRRFMQEAKGNPTMQKALAVAIRIKACIGRESAIHNWSINKIHRLSGISAKTLLRYIPILEEMGIITYCGKQSQHLVITKLASHSAPRNICIDKFDFSSFRSVYNSLRAFLAMTIQHHKDFIRRMIHAIADPKDFKEFQAARRTMKRLVNKGIACFGQAFKENGISYKRIAKETGNCTRTAEKIVDFAVSHGWMDKIRNCKWWFMPSVNSREVEGFTFTTKRYGYVIYSNSYELSRSVACDLGHSGW